MARAAPIQAGFNNGEISPYMYGRVDVEKYPLSLRECTNMRTVVQGPTTKRDGSRFVAPVADETQMSRLFEFEFSPTQGYIVEVNSNRARFLTNRGLVTETSKAVTGITQANPAVVTCASHGYNNGDQVLFPVVGPYTALQNQVFTVAGVTTNTFQLSGYNGTSLPAFSGSPTVARVYSVPMPFSATDLPTVTDLQSADVLTLFHGKYQPQQLSRLGAASWSLAPFVFKDGPYMTQNTLGTTLTPSGTGNPVPVMTSNTAPSGTAADSAASTNAWQVFDANINTSDVMSSGTIGFVSYMFPGGVSKVVDAYTVVGLADSYPDDVPTAWSFDGYDGTKWVSLDQRTQETGWSNSERRYYSFSNTTAYQGYRFNYTGGGGADQSSSRISELIMHENGDFQTPFNITANNTVGINNGAGFLSTDVGRTIRLLGKDGRWRWARIMGVTSTTVCSIVIYGQSLPDMSPILQWRLGLFSNTTGWPSCATYYQDRLALSGPPSFPDYLCFSTSGVYDTFTPSEDDGKVTEASGFAYELIERQVTAVNWLQAMYRGLIVSTAEGEAIVQPMVTSFTTPAPFSALNIKTVWPTQYGSIALRPKMVDTATLFVDRRGRRVREMAYELQSDSFVAPNMNAMADHITQNGGIKRIAWMRHPDRIYWAVRADGYLLGFTYEREQQVNAWHKHVLGGVNAKVEDCAVISSPDGMNEDLWLIVTRTIGGVTRRYIEYIGDWFWHDTQQQDACFVDASVKYVGSPVSTVTGLAHLEGQTVRVLADGNQQEDTVVTNGSITIPVTASTITVGLGYKGRVWTLRPNAGAQNGTAQGKIKKIYKYVVRLYKSLGGTIGDANGRMNQLPYYWIVNSFLKPLGLYSGDIGPLPFPGGWELDGGAVFESDNAYPFTVTAFMPQLITEDA